MSHLPKVSVVIPVYNCQDYVSAAIESILAQTFTDFELLLIDDASTDGSAGIMRAYTDSRIRLVSNEVNQGIPKTHNKGIQLARGEYVAMLDHDDYSYPERLARQVVFLDHNRDCAVLGTWGEVIHEEARGSRKIKRFPVWPGEVQSSLLFMNCVLHPSIMGRRAVMETYGYCERYSICDDFDLFVRIAQKHQLANLPTVLVRHRRHDSRTSNRKAHLKKGENLHIFNAQLSELGIRFTEADLERHFILARMKTLGFRPDAEYLDWAEAWLRKLQEANGRTSRYPHPHFGRILVTMWAKACWHASGDVGWRVGRRFLRSPLSKGAWPSLRQHLMYAWKPRT